MLEDLPTIFEIGREFGIVQVFENWKRPRDGFGIGAPEAAGASSVYVASREEEEISVQPVAVRWELQHRVWMRRWMDDIIQIFDVAIGWATRSLLRRMRQKHFCGPELDVEEERGAAGGFGFEVTFQKGVVKVKGTEAYLTNFARDGKAKKSLPAVQGGGMYASRATLMGTVCGRLSRLLDTTNGTEEEVMSGVRRLNIALLAGGFPAEVIRKGVRRVRTKAWCRLEDTLDVLGWTETVRRVWSLAYDGECEMRKRWGAWRVQRTLRTT